MVRIDEFQVLGPPLCALLHSAKRVDDAEHCCQLNHTAPRPFGMGCLKLSDLPWGKWTG